MKEFTTTRAARGQAMTEFLIACLVLVPLFMGAVYLAKYSDIKQSAIQASRYAAMDRAFDPKKPSLDIERETRVRFFAQQERRNLGALTRQDRSYAPDKEQDLVPFWRDLGNNRLIDNFDRVTVGFHGPMKIGGAGEVLNTAGKLFGLDSGGMYGADVEVSLANVKHFEPLSKINLKIGATTVVAGNAWNAGGNGEVVKRVSPPDELKAVVGGLTTGLDAFFSLFEQSGGPQLWCINPNVVPSARLEGGLQNYQNYAPCRS